MSLENHPLSITRARAPFETVLVRALRDVKEVNPQGIMKFTIPIDLVREASIANQSITIRRARSLGNLPSLQRGTPVAYSDKDMQKILQALELRSSIQVHADVEEEEIGETDKQIFLPERQLSIVKKLSVDRIPVLV